MLERTALTVLLSSFDAPNKKLFVPAREPWKLAQAMYRVRANPRFPLFQNIRLSVREGGVMLILEDPDAKERKR